MSRITPAGIQPVLIALGANLPDRGTPPSETLLEALATLTRAAPGFRVLRQSRLYRTPCFPPGAGPDYVNAAAALQGPDDPEALLDLLHRIEASHGRRRETRWGMRTLDLDLLAMGQTVLPDAGTHGAWRRLDPMQQARAAPDRLILPHPRMQDRAFVLVPLREIAPDWVHPVLKLSVAQMCDALPAEARAEVVPL